MKTLKQIMIEYAEARGGGLPLTAQEMCNAIVLWCQQYLNETSGVSGVIVSEQEGKMVISADMAYIEDNVKANLLNAPSLVEMFEGSDTIVVDVSEDNSKIEFHIDYELIQKIDRAVLTPLVNPAVPKLPVLGVDGSIVWEPVSDFVSDVKLYKHTITIYKYPSDLGLPPPQSIKFVLLSTKSSSMSYTDIINNASGSVCLYEPSAISISDTASSGIIFGVSQLSIQGTTYLSFTVNTNGTSTPVNVTNVNDVITEL